MVRIVIISFGLMLMVLQPMKSNGQIEFGNPMDSVLFHLRLIATLNNNLSDSAIKLAESAYRISIEANEPIWAARAAAIVCARAVTSSKFSLQNLYADRLLELGDKLANDSFRTVGNLFKSSYHNSMSVYDKALEHAAIAIKLSRKSQIDVLSYRAHSLMAQIYQIKGDVKAAEKILTELVDNKKIKDLNSRLGALHTLANLKGMTGKYEEALKLDSIALSLMQGINEVNSWHSSFYDNMANCYMYMGKYDLAESFFKKSYTIDSINGNLKLISDNYLNMGDLKQRQGRYDESINYLSKSIDISKQVGFKQATYQAYNMLSSVYEKIGKFPEAMEALRQGYQWKDSITSEKKEIKISQIQATIDTERHQHELALVEMKANRRNWIILALSSVIATLVLSWFFLNRRRQYEAKMKLQEAEYHLQEVSARGIINAGLLERERIAHELHDSLGQLLSATKMNLSVLKHSLQLPPGENQTQLQKVEQMMDDSVRQVRSISHDMLPSSIMQKGMEQALMKDIDRMNTPGFRVSFASDGSEKKLSTENAYIIYRIILECLNNTMKYAQATSADVSINSTVKDFVLIIEDNGVGIDMASLANNGGTGLKNIQNRIDYLKGHMSISTDQGKGTCIALHFPKEKVFESP